MRRSLNNDSEQLISRSKVNCDSIIWSQIFNTFCSLKYEPRREKKNGNEADQRLCFRYTDSTNFSSS